MSKVCLDLFAGLGGFSAAFEDSDRWTVVTVDREPDFEPDICADIMDLRPGDLPDPDVILASPPCTHFSKAGNHDKWDGRRPLGESRESVLLAYHTVGLIQALSPDWWFLENPNGRLQWFFGEPRGRVSYCQYGMDYMKPTDLWGRHPPMTYRYCGYAEDCHTSNGEDDGYSAIASMPSGTGERALVPYELSESILQAVESFGEQATLPEVVPFVEG